MALLGGGSHTGGQPAPSATHQGEATHTAVLWQCGPGETTIASPNPFVLLDEATGEMLWTGSFFLSLRLDGPRADEVDQVWVAPGANVPHPAGPGLCEATGGIGGAYYEGYRVDGPDGGWMVGINTLVQPDGPYGYVVRAVTAGGELVASAIAYATVDNHAQFTDQIPGYQPCPAEIAKQCPYLDRTPPYPHVQGIAGVPRGETAQGTCADGAYLAFGEHLDAITVSAGLLQAVEPLYEDVDFPPFLEILADTWGPAYCLTGTSGAATVVAEDAYGNLAVVELP